MVGGFPFGGGKVLEAGEVGSKVGKEEEEWCCVCCVLNFKFRFLEFLHYRITFSLVSDQGYLGMI
jgi:hypothetical protein